MSDQTTGGSTASSLLESAKGVAGEALGEARARAGDVASRTAEAARAEAMSRAEGAKDGLASQGERLAEQLRSAAAGGDESIQAKLMAAAADSVSDLSQSLRGKSFDQLVADAGDFARRNPGAFVAAAALAGFAVARFARASAPAASSYGDIEGTGTGSAYGSPRQMGSGYASGGSDSGFGGQGYGSGSFGGQSQGGQSQAGMGQGSQFQSGMSQGGTGQGGTGGLAYGTGRVAHSGLSTHDADTDEDGDDFEDSSVEAAPGTGRTGGSVS